MTVTIFQSLIKKEALHIVRDRRTMIITLVMPLVLLLLFGFAISMEINDVRVALVADSHTPQTREIVSEKETGTMDLLLVSPVRPGTIIFGKLVPYFLLSCVLSGIMLLLAYTVLGLPVSYTIVSVVVVSMLYVVLSLAIGLLVSTIVSNQVSALIVSAVLFMLPVIMLSGMIFPIDNMPAFFRLVSCVIPARWYIEAMRKLMIQQLEFRYILQEFFILLGMTVLLLVLSIKKFNTKHSAYEF